MESLLAGLTLGFAAGISPGPLLTLLVSSTLERGFGAGLRVAIAPLLTDGPVILIALLVLRELPAAFLRGITLIGGLFVLWIGITTIATARGELPAERVEGGDAGDIRRGVLVNLLSPHPWIFWVTVGGPILLAAWRRSPLEAVGFVAVFYGLIVGSKIVFAWLVAHGRRFLKGRWYRRILATAGTLLVVLGVLLAWKGVSS